MNLSIQKDTPRLGKHCSPGSDCSLAVFTVCHSIHNFWTYYCMVKPLCSNFRIITAIVSDTCLNCTDFYGSFNYSKSNLKCNFRPVRRTHPNSLANYFKIMQFFMRNWVYTPNFGLKIRIFLRLAPPFVKTLKFTPPFLKICLLAWTHFEMNCPNQHSINFIVPKLQANSTTFKDVSLFLYCLKQWLPAKLFCWHHL